MNAAYPAGYSQQSVYCTPEQDADHRAIQALMSKWGITSCSSGFTGGAYPISGNVYLNGEIYRFENGYPVEHLTAEKASAK